MMMVATHSRSWRVATSQSQSVVWATPPALFMALDLEFDFSIDVAADDGNTNCERFYSKETDALGASWSSERVFCNPPYGKALNAWVRKAMLSAQDDGSLVVMVLPARTGNRWFHEFVLPHAEIRFIRGRLNFTLGGGGRKNAPFDSMVVVFRPFAFGGGRFTAQPTFPGFGRG